MPRLRSTRTGVVVSVDDATAAQLGSGFEPVKPESKPDPKPAPKRRAPARKK